MKKNIIIAVLIAGSVISAPAIAQPSAKAKLETKAAVAKKLESEIEKYLTGKIVISVENVTAQRDLSINPATAQMRLLGTKFYLPDYTNEQDLAKAAVDKFLSQWERAVAGQNPKQNPSHPDHPFSKGYRYNVKVVNLGDGRYDIFIATDSPKEYMDQLNQYPRSID